jgi:hypothetical protein
VILTQNPSSAGQGVLIECPRRAMLACCTQVDSQVAGDPQGERVVVAQDPAGAKEGILT